MNRVLLALFAAAVLFTNVDGGDAKWCCDSNGWVEADFGSKRYTLTSFTATSGTDFAAPAAYSIFRYQTFSVVNFGMHQIGELEFFGTEETKVPEPGSVALFGLGLLAALGMRRKRA